MTAYDFWEPLSLRLPIRVMRVLSGHGEVCEHSRNRARSIESWIHDRIVPIGLLREVEPSRVCRSCGHTINPACDDHFAC